MTSGSKLKTALQLRAFAIAIFPIGVVLLALLERSVLMVGVLALGMMIASFRERSRLPEARALMTPAAMFGGLAVRFGLMAGLFVICLGVLALFRDTALARGFGWIDLAIFTGLTGAALLANEVSARMAGAEIRASRGQMEAMFGDGTDTAASSEEGIIIEGEFTETHRE